MATSFERLPKDVVPTHYSLLLDVDLKGLAFDGEEDINLNILSPTKTIKLHSADLEIKSVRLSTSSQGVLYASTKLHVEDEILECTFDQAIQPGNSSLHVEFHGILNDKMKGFYRARYVVNNEERFMGVTQFEATDARRCFPCWDEPAVKATFQATMVIPKDRIGVSNMPCVSEVPHGEKKKLSFAVTPKMSTYLVAFVVGEFDVLESTTPRGTLIRVFTPVGKRDQGIFALEVATKTLPFYEKWFGVEYPLPKCDLLAIPDFAAGAMENWGCTTYRETALLVDEKVSSTVSKQYVALVVGHELAHQWFGNIVTMEWWTHLWLNEGFASFVEYMCVDHCFPEWNIWSQFIVQDLNRALELDSLESSHPVEVAINHPKEIDEIFDAISYSKGASIIRMLDGFLGESFQKGLQHYINKHSYGNTFTEDLWNSLTEKSSINVRELMDTWTKQTGYPLLTVSMDTSSGKKQLKVSQKRFFSSPVHASTPSSQLWVVPVSIATSTGQRIDFVLKTESTTVDLPNDVTWVKLNAGNTGVYRVLYDSNSLELLQVAIKNGLLSLSDKLGIINDLFALSIAGLLPTNLTLNTLLSFVNETDYNIWSIISIGINELDLILSNSDFYNDFKEFARFLFSKVSKEVGWEPKTNEGHFPPLTRGVVLSSLAYYGDTDTIKESQHRFHSMLEGKGTIIPDLRRVVYPSVLSNDSSKYNDFLQLYQKSDSAEEKTRILGMLGSVKDVSLLDKTLHFAIGTDVRSQDSITVIRRVARNPLGKELAWKFLQGNWPTLHDRYKGFLLTALVKSVLTPFCDAEKIKEIDTFFEGKEVHGAERSIKQATEQIRTNSMWLQRDKSSIQQFLKDWKSKH